jgi:hypothetical protein
MTRSFGVICRLAIAGTMLLGLTLACTAEEPPPTKYDAGVTIADGPVWPDYGSGKTDMWVPSKDSGPPPKDGASPKEGGSGSDGAGPDIKPDGPSNCKSPKVSCKPTCTSKEICTAAKSGTCSTAYFLSGPASNKKALLAIAMGFVDCWNKQASSDTLCSTFDACSMTGTMSEGLVKSWVCNMSQVSDFPSAAKHKTAKSVFGCGIIDQYRPDWKVKSISAKERGSICLSYNSISWWPDKIEVNNCGSYPPK